MSTPGRWGRFRYTPNLPLYEGRARVTDSPEHQQLSEQAAAEGIVLLKNDGLLPLAAGARVALFGKATFDYVKGGGGSGDVTVSGTVNLYDALKALPDRITVSEATIPFYREYVEKQRAQGLLAGCIAEPALPAQLIKLAAAEADTAILSISRYSGEGWDRKMDDRSKVEYTEFTKAEFQAAGLFDRGDFYLSAGERKLVSQLKKTFKSVVVLLNVGSIVDTAWFAQDPVFRAAMLIGQGGMRGAAAAAKALTGLVNPSGRLIDTWAANIADYPSTEGFFASEDYVEYTEDIYVGYRYFSTIPGAAEHVVYPFGYGLSYTTFSVDQITGEKKGDDIAVTARVVNTGKAAGRQVLQLYVQAPQGKLGKPTRSLAAFAKTRLLLPGDAQILTLTVPVSELASYDDLGKVKKAAWVLERGDYRFHLGINAADTTELSYVLKIQKDRVIRQLSTHIAPKAHKKRLKADGTYEKLPAAKPEKAKKETAMLPKLKGETWMGIWPDTRELKSLPAAEFRKNGMATDQVAEGKRSIASVIGEMTDEDLCWLFGGTPNTGVANTCGMGNLPRLGIPNLMTADGPAGLRTNPPTGVTTTAWPVAAMLAATWDTELLESVGKAAAEEVRENNIAIWLAPAMNIHRSPLCGRNFEYFSEDPLITGKMAAAIVRGVQSQHIAATVKHFACNNKETNRMESDSRLSERAAREIYLKGFEIAVKESAPWCVMTSYNIINGVHASENTELLQGILRGEWGFDGLIMTDWWSTGDPYKDLLGGIDVRMPNGVPSRVRQALDKGLIKRADLERAAENLLKLLMKLD